MVQYHALPCNTMQYHAKPCNTMQYYAIPCNIMQYRAIPCIINNCWRSVPLPCGQYNGHFYEMCGYFEAIWERIQNWKKENMSFFHMNTQTSCWILYITLEKSVYSQDFAAKANHSSQPKALSRLFKGLKRSLLSTHQRLSTLSLWLSVNSVKVNSIFVSQFVKNCRQVQRRLPNTQYSITIIYSHFIK